MGALPRCASIPSLIEVAEQAEIRRCPTIRVQNKRPLSYRRTVAVKHSPSPDLVTDVELRNEISARYQYFDST